MTRKFLGLLVTTFLLVTASFAEAQQPTKMARIGVLPAGSPASMATRVEAFRQALRELGYVEGRNIVLEYRYADGKYERYRDLADDLVRLKPDIIVVSSTGFTTVAKEATKTIPIVVAGAGDLVEPELLPALLDRAETSQAQPAWHPI